MLTNDNQMDDSIEPPRKRRAAALAAQKNWQMLNKPDDELDAISEDEIIIINPKSYAKVPQNKTLNNITITKQNSNNSSSRFSNNSSSHFSNSSSHLKKISIPQTIVIDMSTNKLKRKEFRDNDCDYEPHHELRRDLRHKKTTTTPVRKTIVSNNITISNAINIPDKNRLTINTINTNNNKAINKNISNNCAQIICLDSEESRIIKRTNAINYRKPVSIKLHPNEPQVFPIVDELVEEIIGTYIEDEEEYNFTQSDEPTDCLQMEVFNINDKSVAESGAQVIELNDELVSNDNKVNENETKVQTRKPLINLNRKEKQLNYKNSYFDQIIGTLEMECENFDDEFTDNVCFDCEEDILNSQQWNEAMSSKKEYDNYVEVVKSTKNVKFLPQSEVTEPVGVVTTTVSETSRVVVLPTKIQAPIRSRAQNVQLSQSLSRPIPSTLNRINFLTNQRPQRMVTSVPNLIQSSPLNGTILLPVSNSPVISTPLILTTQSPNLTSIPSGVQLFVSQGPQNQTFIMYPKTNSNTNPSNNILNPNTRMSSASTPIYLSNQNNILSQHLLNTTTPTSQIRVRAPTPTSATQSQYLRVVRPPVTASRTTAQNNHSYVTYGSNAQNNTNVRKSVPNTNNSNISNTNNSKPNNVINNDSDCLFDCIYVLKGNPNKKVNARTLLTIKPLPFSWPSSIDALIASLIKLDNALMKEKFKESPISWMVSAQLICPPSCKTCNNGICNQVVKSRDGRNEFWMCNNQRCQSSVPIERPIVFSGPQFDIPVSKLLFIIYYWSIQVDVEDLIKTGQIEMGTDVIYYIWQKLQKVCTLALQTKDSKLGSIYKTVDVASVQIGRFYVVGAMESGNHRCKLSVVSVTSLVQQNGKELILQPIIKCVEKGTTIRTCEKKFMPLRNIGYKVSLISKSEFLVNSGNSNLTNIGAYLCHHLQRLFKDLDVNTLTFDIINNVLEELLWRERYGTNPFSAFTNIIKHIAEQCGIRKPEQLAPNIQIPISVNQNRSSNNITSRAAGRPPNASKTQVVNDANSIYVDEYYYSSLQLKSSYAKRNSQEEESAKDSIQCHLCQMFFDNILIIKHLLEHLEKERKGRVRKGDNNEPECKHCLRFFSTRTLHMHEELTNLKLIPFSCRICALPLYARNPFIHHMKTSHFSGEMPYYCDICSYRSSFQKNLFDHFEAAHSSIDSVMCPFCVRVFNLSKHKNLSQFVYRHLASHYAVASVYDCDKCVLTFTTKGDLREHCFKGHNPSNAIDEKFDIIPYVVQQEEIQLCVKALEKELFTPNLPTFGNVEYCERPETAVSNNQSEIESFQMSCDPFANDFTIEPEVQISLTDNKTPVESFILAVDCDYSSEQLKKILSKSFKISSEIIPSEKGIIMSNNKSVKCYECNTLVNIDHYMSKGVCDKCNYITHCKKAFKDHKIKIHSTSKKTDSNVKCLTPSVLSSFQSLNSYNIVCKKCQFNTKDGNQMALHMFKSNHFSILCKSLT